MLAAAALIGAFLGVLAVATLHARLLRWLEQHHQRFFVSELGAPTDEQLTGNAYSGARRTLQWRFIRFRWSGEFLKLNDPHVNLLNVGLMAGEVVTIICTLVAFVEIKLK